MDAFVFLPSLLGPTAWADTADMCLHSGHRRDAGGMPEQVLHLSVLRHNWTYALLSHDISSRIFSQASKLSASGPPKNYVVWHSHNKSATARWLDAHGA